MRAEQEAAERREVFLSSLPNTLLSLAARIRPFGEVDIVPGGEAAYRVIFTFKDDVTTIGPEADEWTVVSCFLKRLGKNHHANTTRSALRADIIR